MRSITLFLVCLVFVSCSFERRHYRDGFYWDKKQAVSQHQQHDNGEQQKQPASVGEVQQTMGNGVVEKPILPASDSLIVASTAKNPSDTIYYNVKKTTTTKKTFNALMRQTEDENGLLMYREAKKAAAFLFAGMIFLLVFFPVGVILLIIGLVKCEQVKKKVSLQPDLYSPDNLKLMNQAMLTGVLAGLLVLLFLTGFLVVLASANF